MWQGGAVTERLISSPLKIREGLLLLSEPVIKQNWEKKQTRKPYGEKNAIGFAKGNAAVSNLFCSTRIPSSFQYPATIEHLIKIMLFKNTVSGEATTSEEQLLPVSCQERHFILYYFFSPQMGFCNLWKQYPLNHIIKLCGFWAGGSTGTPSVPLFPDSLMWPSIMCHCPAWPKSPWKEKREGKKPLLMGSFPRKPHRPQFPRGWVTQWPCQHPASHRPARSRTEEGQEGVQQRISKEKVNVPWHWSHRHHHCTDMLCNLTSWEEAVVRWGSVCSPQ